MLEALGLANLVNGGVELRLHVIPIEGDLGLLELLKHPEEVRLAHVLADLGDLVGMAAVRAEVLGEPLNGGGVPPGGGEHAAMLIKVGEQRDVALAAAEARVVNTDALNPRESLARQGFVDVVMDDPPDPRVMLADQGGDRPDRHLLAERHRQRFEQQREPRSRARPRDLDLMHAVLWAADPWDPGGQERLMLEEVEMPPRLLLGVVHLAVGPLALWAREPRSLREVQDQLQPPRLTVEVDAHDAPRLLQPQSLLEEVRIVQARLPSSTKKKPGARGSLRRYPHDSARSPFSA